MNAKNFIFKTFDYTKDLFSLHELHPERYPFYLESQAHGRHARYDILFAFPGETLTCTASSHADTVAGHTQFLDQFDSWYNSEKTTESSPLPFSGGWFVYLGYELNSQIEPSINHRPLNSNLPVAFATRVPCALIKDHVENKMIAVCEKADQNKMRQIQNDFEQLQHHPGEPLSFDVSIEEESSKIYLHAIEKIKQYIVDGDVFQVNLSRLWHGKLPDKINSLSVYRSLRLNNPSPFAGCVNYRGTYILSSSPERLVKVNERIIETNPIAGTRPRHVDKKKDNALIHDLKIHPKERAEHVMLIDLERNDLGRVCAPGSIHVANLMDIESFAHVHHIVSIVRGELTPKTSPGEILRAVFPGGTITGCPKVRCMEIIAELEQQARGPYTGSFGYINRNGNMDFNILIRTLLISGNDFELRAGAGIVADSIPSMELAETRSKAKGLLHALGIK